MKYLVLIGDGMSDEPLKSLDGRTPLEVARTPNMDFLASSGTCGWVSNIPRGMAPGSDVAAMSILGYDPARFYTGRGPLEAASLGIKLDKDEVCFRCNLVSIIEGKMESFTAGHITTKEADKIIKTLNQKWASPKCRFYTGLSYRHLFVVKDKSLVKVKTTPPHDITGQKIMPYLPNNDYLKSLMLQSYDLLKDHAVNQKRKDKAQMIWLWGQGLSPSLKEFPKKGAIITAVHLLKGLGRMIGLEVIDVPGATGYLDTNYEGKAKYAMRALLKKDIVFVHVEAPDEAGHMGDADAKIKAIEDFDKIVVGAAVKKLDHFRKLKILVLPDHPTPINKMTHTSDPVPFIIFGPDKIKGQASAFNEKALKNITLKVAHGHQLLKSHFLA